MSGISGLGSLVLTLFPSSSDSDSANILSAIYGGSTASTTNPLDALQEAAKNETQGVAAEAKQPQVAKDIAAFTKAVQTATSPAQLLKDTTVLKVLLTANGLGDQAQYPALAQKALLSNTNDSDALANKLSDTQWKDTAQLFDFANKGLSVIQNPKVISTLTNGYSEVLWRQSLDQTTPGLSTALSFRQSASTITSALQILGNTSWRNLVTTALDIPPQIAFQDLGAQEAAINSHLDVKKLQDPNFVNGLISRFLLNSQQSASSQTPSLSELAVSARPSLYA